MNESEKQGTFFTNEEEAERTPTLAKLARRMGTDLGIAVDFKLHGSNVTDEELDYIVSQFLLATFKLDSIDKSTPIIHAAMMGMLMEKHVVTGALRERAPVFIAGRIEGKKERKEIEVEVVVIANEEKSLIARLVEYTRRGADKSAIDEVLALGREHADVEEWLDAHARVNALPSSEDLAARPVREAPAGRVRRLTRRRH